jgi:uncharacterized membrane protein
MIDFTPAARQRFDDYFQTLRGALRGSSRAEMEDVEQSVREHFEVALAGHHEPVNSEQLAEIIDRLGNPDRWVPVAERSLVARVVERLRSGPEDWRLAYAAFGLFLLSLLLLPVGVGALLLFGSYLASRAYVDFMEAKEAPLDGRRWLIYPPIAVFLGVAVALLIIGAAGPVLGWGLGNRGFELIGRDLRIESEFNQGRFMIGATITVLGSWWFIASLLGMVVHPVSRFLFKPLLANVRRTHFLGLTLIGALSLSLGITLLSPWIQWPW